MWAAGTGTQGEVRNSTRQVFFDPTGRRALAATVIACLVLFSLRATLGGLLVAILSTPVLPHVNLPLQGDAVAVAGVRPSATPATPQFASNRNRAVSSLNSGRIKRQAFYVNWDDQSFASLVRNADSLDTVFAEWLHIEGASGEIRRTDANREAVQSWVVENAPALEVLPLINNYDGETGVWNGQDLGKLLSSAASRARLIEGLLTYVGKAKFSGIVIDFEQIAG